MSPFSFRSLWHSHSWLCCRKPRQAQARLPVPLALRFGFCGTAIPGCAAARHHSARTKTRHLQTDPLESSLLGHLCWRPCFYIFKDDGDRHARALEHPRAAYFSRDAFHRRALRPIERCHGRILLSNILYPEPIRRGRTENRNAERPPFQKPKTKGWGARESSRGSICAPPAGIWNCKKAKERQSIRWYVSLLPSSNQTHLSSWSAWASSRRIIHWSWPSSACGASSFQ